MGNKKKNYPPEPDSPYLKIWKFIKVLPWKFTTILATLLAFTVIYPSVSLTNSQTNNESVLSAKFLLANDGLWFSVKDVKITCVLTVTGYKNDYNGPKLDSHTNAIFPANVHELKSKEKISNSCEFPMLEGMPRINGVSGVSLTPKEILTYATKAHLLVSVTYTPFFQWPLEKKFPFTMDLDGKSVYWTEEPLELYNSAVKEHLHLERKS